MSDEIQHRHAHRQAVGYLRQYSAVGAVGYFRAYFYAAVHRAGVHYEDVFFAFCEAFCCEAEEAGEFSYAGELAASDPLELHAEHVDHVDLTYDGIEVVNAARAERFECSRKQRRRPHKNHFRAKLFETPQIRAGDAAISDVTNDGNL
jgi:hypothetical protein